MVGSGAWLSWYCRLWGCWLQGASGQQQSMKVSASCRGGGPARSCHRGGGLAEDVHRLRRSRGLGGPLQGWRRLVTGVAVQSARVWRGYRCGSSLETVPSGRRRRGRLADGVLRNLPHWHAEDNTRTPPTTYPTYRNTVCNIIPGLVLSIKLCHSQMCWNMLPTIMFHARGDADHNATGRLPCPREYAVFPTAVPRICQPLPRRLGLPVLTGTCSCMLGQRGFMCHRSCRGPTV